MEDLKADLQKSVSTSLIDYREDSIEDYRPKLIANNYKKGTKVINFLIKELSKCEEFYFSVAFITNSGLNLLLNIFKELENKGIKGKVLTTNYLNFNDPSALRRLLNFSNLDVKVYDDGNFHSKGYIFKNPQDFSFIIGSSNLSQEALTSNEEWNIKITSLADGELLRDTVDEFNDAWEKASNLTEDWIKEYEIAFKNSKMLTPAAMKNVLVPEVLSPNKMQCEAMKNLEELRADDKNKALLISATGTGKTYLSAFDVKQFNPDKMLFVVHREQIAKDAKESFKNIFGNSKTMGIFSGNYKETDCDFVFSTVQTMSKPTSLELFDKNHFDYIIVDEVHHAGANTYQNLINYFQPKFLLGMTATPDRTDGFNIYEMFDYNIAYEIRLQHALENDMLCPFHYFGVAEIEVDGETLNESAAFNQLVSENRVQHIIENTEFYGHSGNRVKGLIFCSRNDEATELSRLFNERGYKTVALSGASSQEEREQMVERLEQDSRDGGLDYIFTVDIFNEGVDIPKVNQIVMLRPTESAIVFVQQLGRGLRKNPEKDFVVVIDFIGNYQNSFLIPVALSGNRNYKKDELNQFMVNGTALIPGCSSVMFDPIVKEIIYKKISSANFSKEKFLREKYFELRNKIGRIPKLVDFYNHDSVDPQVILKSKKNYPEFVKKAEPEAQGFDFSEDKIDYLKFITKRVSDCKRLHEVLATKMLLEKDFVSYSDLNSALIQFGIIDDYDGIRSAFSVLSGGFYVGNTRQFCHDRYIAQTNGDAIKMNEGFKQSLNDEMLEQINDILEYASLNWQDNYSNRYENTNLCLYSRYSISDALKMLNWKKDEYNTIFGDPRKPRVGTYPIFVTYKKEEGISESTKYEDGFIDRDTFSWFTTNGVKMDSDEIRTFQNLDNNKVKVQLFIKKDGGEEYCYMGNVKPLDFRETTIKKKGKDVPIVNIKFRLDVSVREDIYDYITDKN